MNIRADQNDDGEEMVNLTPLIDVVFLLLIFFMVTSTFQQDERDLTITVPQAENGNPIEDLPETLFVGVRKDGVLSVGGKVLAKHELRELLVKAKRRNKKQKVITRVDGDAAFKHSAVVLDLCTGLKIETSVAVAMTASGN